MKRVHKSRLKPWIQRHPLVARLLIFLWLASLPLWVVPFTLWIGWQEYLKEAILEGLAVALLPWHDPESK